MTQKEYLNKVYVGKHEKHECKECAYKRAANDKDKFLHHNCIAF